MKQNDAVFQAVCSVLGADSFDSAVELTKDQRESVVSIVVQGIVNGSVDFSAEAKAKYDTPAKVKSYTTGMVSNHLRKDKRLNGNTKYEIKNPGSRAGSGDDQLKALKALKSTLTSADDIAAVDKAIATRTEEIRASKVKEVEINVEALPEAFRHLVK
jgi:prophage DNA circulation protein